ncbi:MAG TPA: PAS domain S-box protein, partial [Thiobacillaceae bacterium]|nr:PAS domain S-box protein [Thiobacillaceae bacterium]
MTLDKRLVRQANDDFVQPNPGEERVALLERAFQCSPVAILITDRNNRILAVNQSFTRLTGYDSEDVLGETPA